MSALEDGRFDKVLADVSGLSRVRSKRLIQQGLVRLNGETVLAPARPVQVGDRFEMTLPPLQPCEIAAENIALDILYEDDDLLIVDKPAGMSVHPGPGQSRGTLVNALLFHGKGRLSGIGGVIRPGIVHRIDKDTSGILVVAKHDVSHQKLAVQFAAHDIDRRYDAFVLGIPDSAKRTLEGFIGRHPKQRVKMAMLDEGKGKFAKMTYECVQTYGASAARILCRLFTGRTHQIRVQMASVGHPLIGDAVYGGKQKSIDIDFPRQALHAAHLGFIHPMSGAPMSFASPPPEDMRRLADRLACL